jgi:DNA processing protein
MERDELTAWLRLQQTPGVGNMAARQLLRAFGLPAHIFEQSSTALQQVVSARQAQALLQTPSDLAEQLQLTENWLQVAPESRRILTLGDADYPTALLDIEDPPYLLYAIASPALWESHWLAQHSQRCMAIVGSRNPTPQGAHNARQFAQALAGSGLTIVSGLALGVDGAAHEGALAATPPGPCATIAVVATGLDRVYPKQHHSLAQRIAQQGLLLSEYAIGTAPLTSNFPKRNRIIAGLSQGTLVVEAALRSGSLITAQQATEQGKEVFAIPGSIHSPQSRGCHALIRQGAKLVESAQDILEELQLHAHQPERNARASLSQTNDDDAADLNPTALRLRTALGFDPTSLDMLQARTGLDTATLQAELMGLELQGQVARLAGGLFQRLARA